jgi:hypothetical protein
MMFHFFSIYKIIRVLLILSFVLVAHTLKAQTVRSDVYLHDQPEGQTTKNLVKANSAIKVLQRKSFWVEIQSENKRGWLKLNAIQFMTATNAIAIDTGRTGKNNIVATSVSRGLSAQELTNANPNFDQAKKLKTFAVTNNDAQAFLAAAAIKSPVQKIFLQGENKAIKSTPVSPKNIDSKTTPKAEDDW